MTIQEPLIISASRRTDIPAFFSGWLMSRIADGCVEVRNPFKPSQVRTVSLKPEDVAAFVFWTRDFSPLLDHAGSLDAEGYRYSILWTVTGYPGYLEPGALPLEQALRAFRDTSSRVGPGRLAWRYDPIVITEDLSPSLHIGKFKFIAETLRGYTDRVIVSLMTPYSFVTRRLRQAGLDAEAEPLVRRDVQDLLAALAALAGERGMSIQACCHGGLLVPFGITDGACIDGDWLGIAPPFERDKGQRRECLCTRSVDIGAYDTCPRGCLYCYAVRTTGRSFPG
jgi:hypothetical protein